MDALHVAEVVLGPKRIARITDSFHEGGVWFAAAKDGQPTRRQGASDVRLMLDHLEARLNALSTDVVEVANQATLQQAHKALHAN